VVEALRYKPGGREFEIRCGECLLSIYLILPAVLGPEVYSVSKRNAFHSQKNALGGVKRRPVRKAYNLTAICEPII
jgi:hypothetical protein